MEGIDQQIINPLCFNKEGRRRRGRGEGKQEIDNNV